MDASYTYLNKPEFSLVKIIYFKKTVLIGFNIYIFNLVSILIMFCSVILNE